MRMQVRSLALLGGLRIWRSASRSVGHRCGLTLRSGVAAARMKIGSCSSDSTPRPGTSICGYGPKKKKQTITVKSNSVFPHYESRVFLSFPKPKWYKKKKQLPRTYSHCWGTHCFYDGLLQSKLNAILAFSFFFFFFHTSKNALQIFFQLANTGTNVGLLWKGNGIKVNFRKAGDACNYFSNCNLRTCQNFKLFYERRVSKKF